MPEKNMAPQLIHFYLDTPLWTGLSVDEVRARLQLVIDACNSVWKKNTSLRWNLGNITFDTQSCPKSNSPCPGPVEGFPYHVQLVAGGRGSFMWATDGGVCAWNLRCAGLTRDVDSVQFTQLVNDILHEYGHLVQGEGYFCITFKDLDRQVPILPDADVRYGTADSLRYWKTDARRVEYMRDPMVRTSPWREIKWSSVNAMQLDKPQNRWLDLPSRITIRVTLDGVPVKGAKVLLFDCEYSGMAEEAKLYWRAETDSSGIVTAQYDYDDGGLPADNVTDRDARYRMWKVIYGDKMDGNYLSVIDLWEASISGRDGLDIDVRLGAPTIPTTPETPTTPTTPTTPGTGLSDLTRADLEVVQTQLQQCAAALTDASVELRKIARRL